MFIMEYSIFIEENKYNGVKESPLSKYILVFVLIISLCKRDNDRNILLIECIFDIDVKPVSSHQVQTTPSWVSYGSRELLDLRENIIRKLHFE